MTFGDPAGIPDPGSVRKSNFVKGFLKKKLTFGVTFLYFLLIFIDFHRKNKKKCNTLRNLDFRGCESVELSAFPGKKIHTACILEKREAYRSTPGAPDVRFAYYLQHFCGSGNQPQKNQKKCNTLRNLDFRGCESVELSAFY